MIIVTPICILPKMIHYQHVSFSLVREPVTQPVVLPTAGRPGRYSMPARCASYSSIGPETYSVQHPHFRVYHTESQQPVPRNGRSGYMQPSQTHHIDTAAMCCREEIRSDSSRCRLAHTIRWEYKIMSDNMMKVQRIWCDYVAVLRSDLSVEIISRLRPAQSKLTALYPNTIVDLHHVSHK